MYGQIDKFPNTVYPSSEIRSEHSHQLSKGHNPHVVGSRQSSEPNQGRPFEEEEEELNPQNGEQKKEGKTGEKNI